MKKLIGITCLFGFSIGMMLDPDASNLTWQQAVMWYGVTMGCLVAGFFLLGGEIK